MCFGRQISEKGISGQFLPVSLSRSNSSSAGRLTEEPLGTTNQCKYYIMFAEIAQPSKWRRRVHNHYWDSSADPCQWNVVFPV